MDQSGSIMVLLYMGTRQLSEALKTTAAKCSKKERALSMVTPRNFDSEVVLREDLFSCIEGCQRASSKLLVKKAISHLLALQASLGRRLHSATHYGFLHGCFSDFIEDCC